MYKTKLLGNTLADGANGILRNAATPVPLKYLNNFWRSLEMSLINCIVDRNFKWAKQFVLSAACADNAHVYSNDITFTFKDTD